MSRDIPWPRANTLLKRMEEADSSELPTLYKKLAMAYHPDKLMQRIRQYMIEGEHSHVERKACALFQQIAGHYELLTQQGTKS